MVSRRNYATITIIMVIVFFLFQLLNIAKARWNNYQTNTFAQSTETLLDQSSVYQVDDEQISENGIEPMRVVCIGTADQKNSLGQLLKNWGLYMKYSVSVYDSVSAYQEEYEANWTPPQFFLIDSDCIQWKEEKAEKEVKLLENYAGQGSNLIFANLPDVSVIKKNQPLRELLGIASVRQDQVTVQGIHLYDGLLLGGEIIYQADTKEEEERQDFELTFPWYQLTSATKVYMKGILDEESVDRQNQPALIWRKSTGNSYVFAVNGTYMSGITGLGLLTGMLCQMQPDTIYPVVNAQNFVLASYPGLADENSEVLQELYSQTMSGVFRDVIWPSISVISQKNSLNVSSMITMQYDYTDEDWPQTENLSYYMEAIREINGEMGYSGLCVSDTDIKEKLMQDESFWSNAIPTYRFSSFYQGTLNTQELETALQSDFLAEVCTVVEPEQTGSDLIGYVNNHVTKQNALVNGCEYTYSQDFMVRSAETALGYNSILVDLARVAYPQSNDDAWEKVSKELMANTTTYTEPFAAFEKTTVSECDRHIRNFLAMSYTESREENRIQLDLRGTSETTWFVAKLTENEKIVKVEGGNFSQIEKGVWLIEAEDAHVEIILEKAAEQFYYE